MQKNVLYMNANMITALYWIGADEENRAPFLTMKDISFLAYKLSVALSRVNSGIVEIYPIMFDSVGRVYNQNGMYFSWSMDSRIYPYPEPYDRDKDMDGRWACKQVSELLFATLGMHDVSWCKKVEAIDETKYKNAWMSEEGEELEARLGESAELREYLFNNSIAGKGYNEAELIGINTDLLKRDRYVNILEGEKFDGPSRETIYFYGRDIEKANKIIPRAEKEKIEDGFKKYYRGSLVYSEDFKIKQFTLANIPAGDYNFNLSLMERGCSPISALDFIDAMKYACKDFDRRGYSGINRSVWRNGFKDMAENKNNFFTAFVKLSREQRRIEIAYKLGEQIYYEDGSSMEEKMDELTRKRRKLQEGYRNGEDEVERIL